MQNKIRFIKDLLWFFVFWGLVIAVFRMWFGLGATTNLTDEVPWGLWKILNMIAGVALSTCGFTVGFLAYVLNIERFKPLVRPAILIAFLGYGSSCLALMFDIGLPHRFWHPFVMWNEHSFLFEVFWCVILYFTVTFIELTPNILERFKSEKIVKFLHKIAIGVVIFGISLSSLHHSSLGSLFLTTPLRLHELWYTPWIPWMFIVSAMGGGMMFLILAKLFYARFYNPISVFGHDFQKKSEVVCTINGKGNYKIPKVYGKDMPMLSSLAIISASLLGLYLIMKIYDLLANGSINALLAGTWESWLFLFELIVTAILPITLIAIKRTRTSPYGLGIAAFSASFGVALNRMDVGIFGYFRDAGTIYFPSLGEWSLSIGVVAAAALAFIYISENFSIFDDKWKKQKIEKGIFSSAFDSFSRVWTSTLHDGVYRVTLIAVFTLPVAFVLMYPPYSSVETKTTEPASGLDIKRTVLLINGNANEMQTEFPHEVHQKLLGGEQSCNQCHHISMPNDNSTPCARCHRNMLHETNIFDHSYHTVKVAEDKKIGGLHPENNTCYICHAKNQAKTPENAAECTECHIQDMNIILDDNSSTKFIYADSYMDAMHKNCVPCHQEQEKSINKKLSECTTCHKNMDNKVNSGIKISKK
jgi:Ni/Fe-hydrogenase subunit HybB-like protein